MKTLVVKVHQFLASEDGPTAVEYGVMLALIVLICIAAIRSVGTTTNATFENLSTQMN